MFLKFKQVDGQDSGGAESQPNRKEQVPREGIATRLPEQMTMYLQHLLRGICEDCRNSHRPCGTCRRLVCSANVVGNMSSMMNVRGLDKVLRRDDAMVPAGCDPQPE